MPGAARSAKPAGNGGWGCGPGLGSARDFGIAVDDDLAEKGEEAGGAIPPPLQLQQVRGLIDETGGVVAGDEPGVGDQRFKEGEVGLDAANAEFPQRPLHAPGGLLGCRRPGGDLFQQRIVERGDVGAREGGAAVEPDAEAGSAAIGGQAAVVGREVVFGILGRDPALQGMAVAANRLLRRHRSAAAADLHSLHDADLRLDQIDAGDDFGDGVLDLDARIDLDEVEIATLGIHQELDRAGAHVVRRPGEAHRRVAQRLALGLAQIGSRRALDHLLVAALHRAVPLKQVDDVAVPVAEDLHLDVAGALDQLLEIDLALAEGRPGFAPAGLDLIEQPAFRFDEPHAAAAAAPARLEHQRVADPGRQFGYRAPVLGQGAGRRHHRDPRLLGQTPRRQLVAELAHGVRGRADEHQSGRRAGVGEVRVLGQEAVAGMNRVRSGLARDADDIVDRQIGLDRAEPLADPIGLVRLEAVQRDAVLVRIDGHGLEAELGAGAKNADRDLAAIGDQQFP